jgi:hypothetical protein
MAIVEEAFDICGEGQALLEILLKPRTLQPCWICLGHMLFVGCVYFRYTDFDPC